ncbi:MAG: hypothetical protein WCP55_06745 [Lentisphaerota bacterium]
MQIAREFSWSYSRHRCFNFCRLAYRLRYMDSWEGWDKFATPDSKILYELKNLKTLEAWPDQIFRDTVRDVFMKSRNGFGKFTPAEIRKTALKKLRSEWSGMLSGECKDDPKKLNLTEFYYSDASARRNFDVQQIADTLIVRIDKFAASPVFAEIAEMSYLNYRDFRRPDYFELDGIKIWTAPDFIYSRKDGTLNILNFCNGVPGDNASWDLRAAICVFFALRKFNIPEDKINCHNLFFRNVDEDILCVYSYRNLCEVRRIIYVSAVDMLDFESGTQYEIDSTEHKSPDKCATCEFRKVCYGFAGAEGLPPSKSSL